MSFDEGVQRAPRSGGRTTEQRRTRDDTRRTPGVGGSVGGARGARHFPTQGSAALRAEPAQPLRVTDPPAVPRLRVAPPAPVSAPRAPFVVLIIALVLAGVFGILMINTKTAENSFQLKSLQDQRAALNHEEQRLDRELVSYHGAGNLEAMARKLGLVKSESPAYLRLPDGKMIGVPLPNSGERAVTAQDPPAAPNAGR